MTRRPAPSSAELRQARTEHPDLRPRDLADKLGVSEAALLTAHLGRGVHRIVADPDTLMPAIGAMGEVMALTRNDHCVIEKVGHYSAWHPGKHAAMILDPEIDLRIFPGHWVYGFAVEGGEGFGLRNSLQIFDAAGDAVHKICSRTDGRDTGWSATVARLIHADQEQGVTFKDRVPTEAPRSQPGKRDILRREWRSLTDTHQFLRLASRLKMNRLGAYRIAGTDLAQPVATRAVDDALQAIQARGIEVMIFVGNRGCIEIHGGPIGKLKAVGPWQNVIDPRFNLHLRLDRIAEVWSVTKPTRRGPTRSLEAFDKDGGIILQIFATALEGRDTRPAWNEILDRLPAFRAGVAA